MRLAREQAGYSQESAAAYLGLKGPALSQYETGRRGVDALVLERLARLYGVPLTFFFADGATDPWEHLLREQTAHLSDEARQGVARLIDEVRALEDLYQRTGTQSVPRTPSPFSPLVDKFSRDGAAERAHQVRMHYQLGNAPIRDMKSLLEMQGFLIFMVPLGKADCDLSGLIFWHSHLGAIIALNQQRTLLSRSYDMAHALAHGLYHYHRQIILCCHGDTAPLEDFAHHFASHFLVPRKALGDYLDQMGIQMVTSPAEVVDLSHYFGVNPAVMLPILAAEHRMEGEIDATSLMLVARRLGYPVDVYRSGQLSLPIFEQYPRKYVDRVMYALGQGVISRRRAANLLRMSEVEFDELVEPLAEVDSTPYAVT